MTLGHLRQELAAVFSMELDRIVVVFNGLFLKDDRVSLQEYGITNGARIGVIPREQLGAPGHGRSAAPPAPGPESGETAQDAPHDPDAQHLERIQQVSTHCRETLVPDLENFEASVAALPDAPRGALQAHEPEVDERLTAPTKIPLAQRRLAELLLRELLQLDNVPADKEEIRAARKATVKEVQGYMDRVDAAWKVATERKGLVSDV